MVSPSRCPPWQPERPGPTRREPRRAQRSYTTPRDTISNTGLKAIESFETNVSVSGPDVIRLFEPFGWKTDLGGAFQAEGRASGNLKKAVLRDLMISAGDARLRGNAAVEFFESSPGIMSIPAVKILAISGIEATLNLRNASRPDTLKLKHASLGRDVVDAAIRLSAAGEIDDRRFEVDGEGGSRISLVDSASPYRITLKGEVGPNEFSAKAFWVNHWEAVSIVWRSISAVATLQTSAPWPAWIYPIRAPSTSLGWRHSDR